MGKPKPALGSFHTKQRNLLLKQTVNSSTTQAGVSTGNIATFMGICRELKDTATALAFVGCN